MEYFYILVVIALASYAGAQEIKVSKRQWIDGMKTAVPTAFCQKEQYFRACFKVTQEECEITAASATRICLKNKEKEIPELL